MEPLKEISRFLEKTGLSERALALRLGGSQSTIQHWRYGHQRPRLETARRLAAEMDAVMAPRRWFRTDQRRAAFVSALIQIDVVRPASASAEARA